MLTDLFCGFSVCVVARTLMAHFQRGWSGSGAGNRKSYQLHAFPRPCYTVMSKRHAQGTNYLTEGPSVMLSLGET